MQQTKIQMRDYQQEALNAIVNLDNEGVRRQLVALPTGSGKTIIFAQFPNVFEQRMLIVAHREELLNQARDKLLEVNPDLWVEVEQADRKASPMCDVVVASVATIGRQGSKRLQKFDPGAFDVIVIDEAHHSIASTYMNVMEYFDVFHDDKLLVGFTATPNRGDNVALNQVFQQIAYQKDLREMIDAGWLCPPRAFRVETGTDLSSVHVRQGDYITGELSYVLDEEGRNKMVVESYLAHARGRKALVFAIDVAHAHHLAEYFNESNIPAAAVTGKTSKDERAAILEAFDEGELRVVCNCMVLTEGFDQPDIGAVIMARPTMSGLLYSLDDETEVLTPTGWLKGIEATLGTTIAGFNIKTGTIQWEPVKGHIVRPLLSGERMLKLSSPTLDLRLTDTHRMVWSRRRGRAHQWDPWELTPAKKVMRHRDGWKIPVSGIQSVPGVPLTDDEIRFIGWVMTDGTVNKCNGAVQIGQSTNSKARIEEIERVLTACNFRWAFSDESGPTNFGPRKQPQRVYRVSQGMPRRLSERHLEGWGRLKRWVPKADPTAWQRLEDLDARQWGVLLSAWHLGDGSKQEGQMWTRRSYHLCVANPTIADWLQSMCVRRGWRANIAKQQNGGKSVWMVHCRRGTARCVGGAGSKDRPFLQETTALATERVWCLAVPSGAFISRRNGKVAVVGNTQMVGRGTRRAPDKEDVIIIDLVDNSKRHPLVTIPTLFGLSQEYGCQGQLLMEDVKRMEQLTEEYPHIPIDKATSIEDAQRLLKEFDILGRARELDAELAEYTPFVWVSPSKDVYTMRMQGGDRLTIQQDLLDRWELQITTHDPERPWRTIRKETVATTDGKGGIFSEANILIGNFYANEEVLHARGARWKNDPATPKQVALIDKHRIPHPEQITKGEAGLLLDDYFSTRKRRS